MARKSRKTQSAPACVCALAVPPQRQFAAALLPETPEQSAHAEVPKKSAMRDKLVCGICGQRLVRSKTLSSKGNAVYQYVCHTKKCLHLGNTQQIEEAALLDAAFHSMQVLIAQMLDISQMKRRLDSPSIDQSVWLRRFGKYTGLRCETQPLLTALTQRAELCEKNRLELLFCFQDPYQTLF